LTASPSDEAFVEEEGSLQIIPDRRTFLAGLSVWFFVLAPAMAGEELSIDKLEVQAKIPVGGDFMAFGFDSLWMMSGARMMRVNPADNSVTEIKVDGALGSYRGIAVGEGAIWIPATGSKTIYKLDPITNSVVRQLAVDFYDSEGSIGVGEDAVWIVAAGEKFHAVLTRFNSETGALEANIPLEQGSIAALVDFGSVWVTNNQKNELYRIDPKTNSVVSATSLHERPRFLASGEGAIWVLNQGDATVQRVDGKTGTVVATIETVSGYRGGGEIVVGGGYVWVTLTGDLDTYPVVQIDPKTNTLLRMFKGYGMGDAIRYGAGSLWVSGSNIFRIKPPD
jgi:virginiamycin B lyase